MTCGCSSSGGDLLCVVFQGPEFIQFLQQEYLPSLQVAPEISQVGWGMGVRLLEFKGQMTLSEGVSLQELCQVIQQPDIKVLKNYVKV